MARLPAIILLLTLSLFSCQNTETSTTAPSTTASKAIPNNWQLTTSEGFNIHHPADWEVDLSGFMGSKFLLYLPEVEGDEFRENLNLITQQLPAAPANLQELGELVLAQLSTFVTDVNILSHGIAGNGEYFEVKCEGQQAGTNLIWYQRCFLQDSVAHILAYSADPKDFDAAFAAAQECMDSFKLPK